MNFFQRLLREPVLHFIVVGMLLFTLTAAFRDGPLLPEDDATIVVDRTTLLSFMQFRSNAFDAGAFSAALDAMPAEELQGLIDDYVTEEVLYRESRALGLDSSDYIIRQRMVQKMQFLLADLAGGESSWTETELADYFAQHREVWLVQPSTTFTHVYFDASRRGENPAFEDAMAMRDSLNTRQAGFNDIAEDGDRFHFLRNYVERTYDYIEGQFGSDFAAALQDTQASATWQGPFRSAFGWHVVLLSEQLPARYPELEEVREDVVADFLRTRGNSLRDEMIATVKERYPVVVETLRGAP